MVPAASRLGLSRPNGAGLEQGEIMKGGSNRQEGQQVLAIGGKRLRRSHDKGRRGSIVAYMVYYI